MRSLQTPFECLLYYHSLPSASRTPQVALYEMRSYCWVWAGGGGVGICFPKSQVTTRNQRSIRCCFYSGGGMKLRLLGRPYPTALRSQAAQQFLWYALYYGNSFSNTKYLLSRSFQDEVSPPPRIMYLRNIIRSKSWSPLFGFWLGALFWGGGGRGPSFDPPS